MRFPLSSSALTLPSRNAEVENETRQQTEKRKTEVLIVNGEGISRTAKFSGKISGLAISRLTEVQ
jgi:hypothetical protein